MIAMRQIQLKNPRSMRRKGIYPKPEMHVGGMDQLGASCKYTVQIRLGALACGDY